MKLLPLPCLIAASLLCVSCDRHPPAPGKSGAAVTVKGDPHDAVKHHHPVFIEATTEYTLEDWNYNEAVGSPLIVGTLVVRWVAMEDLSNRSGSNGSNASAPDELMYRVTIFRSSVDEDAIYSLLTLGLQSPRHQLEITGYTGAVKVMIDPPSGAWIDPVTTIPKVPMDPADAGPASGKAGLVDQTKIGFLKFVGKATSCTLYVRAKDRYLYGTTVWSRSGSSSRSGHTNEPAEDPPR